METKAVYRTSDTALATYLICAGFSVGEIDYSGIRYEFIFPNGSNILEHAEKYLAGRALVDPAAYQRINRKLARLIRNRQQWWED